MTIAELRARWQEKHDAATALIEGDSPSPEAVKSATAYFDERDAFGRQIEEAEATTRAAADLKGRAAEGQKWAAEPAAPPPNWGIKAPDVQLEGKGRSIRIDHVASPEEKLMMTGGFRSLGHFAWSIANQGQNGQGGSESARKALGEWDGLQRKMVAFMMERKAPQGMFEMSDPDGGLLVPPQFSNQIYQRMVETNDILQRINPIPMTSNVLKLRAVAEDSRVDGSRGGGILGYWEGEADQYVKSKTKFRPIELNLHKLIVFTYITEELLNDSDVAIDAFIGNLAAREINFKLNDGIVNGIGSGMPSGILASGSLITVAAVTGQGAGTFTYANVLAMYSRIVAGQRGSLVWLYNQDVEPQLFAMYQATGTAAGVLIFTPNSPGKFNLMGSPTVVVEQAQTLGTAGDVIAFATDGYICGTKGGVQSFMSMHLRFDYDEFAYKWRFRFDGQMWDDKPLTPFKGTKTVSSVAVLSSTRT